MACFSRSLRALLWRNAIYRKRRLLPSVSYSTSPLACIPILYGFCVDKALYSKPEHSSHLLSLVFFVSNASFELLPSCSNSPSHPSAWPFFTSSSSVYRMIQTLLSHPLWSLRAIQGRTKPSFHSHSKTTSQHFKPIEHAWLTQLLR